MKWRRWIALIAVCVMLCGLSPASTFAATNIHPLENGDFESGSLQSWQAADSVSVSSTAAYEGTYGCLITGDGDWDDLLSQTFTVLPGYTYSLSFWYKANPMGVSWYLVDGGADGIRLHRGWAGKTDWTKAEVDFTPTADTVYLLFRGSGSHAAEKMYLDCVQVTIHPCSNHTYDNACDTTCNICGDLRQVGDHLYDHACDTTCNHCGYEREVGDSHTYEYPCATLCRYCGAARVGEGEHTYDDVCDTDCYYCGEVREVPHFYDFACDATCSHCGDVRVNISEDAHTYDDIYDADCNLCDHVRIPTPKPMERLSACGAACSTDVNGVAFRFFLEAKGALTNPDRSYIAKSAVVERYNNGVEYKLLRVGAVMSNKKDAVLDLEYVDGNRVIDVKAGYLCKVLDDSISFAVRIINIPTQGKNTLIYARPYYVYSDGKEEIVVYGDVVSQTFNNLYNAI